MMIMIIMAMIVTRSYNNATNEGYIVQASDVIVSKTGISFEIENRSNYIFAYGLEWTLGKITDDDVIQVPIIFETGLFDLNFDDLIINPNESRIDSVNFYLHHGVLEPGSYVFLNYFFGIEAESFLLIEFDIYEETPLNLPELNQQFGLYLHFDALSER